MEKVVRLMTWLAGTCKSCRLFVVLCRVGVVSRPERMQMPEQDYRTVLRMSGLGFSGESTSMMIRGQGSMNPSTENNLFNRLRDQLREHPWSFCILALILVTLNTWWDYHHPEGFLLGRFPIRPLYKLSKV
jgi:hypothetical protein